MGNGSPAAARMVPRREIQPRRPQLYPQNPQVNRNLTYVQQPRYQPQTTSVLSSESTIRMNVHIKRDTLELKQCRGNNQHYLTFKYDALAECVVTFYLFGMEVIDESTQTTS